jgi:hypothetical protein
LNYDQLYLGGGNAAQIDRPLPQRVRIASNEAGLTGGIRLWDKRVWQAIPERRPALRQPRRRKPAAAERKSSATPRGPRVRHRPGQTRAPGAADTTA